MLHGWCQTVSLAVDDAKWSNQPCLDEGDGHKGAGGNFTIERRAWQDRDLVTSLDRAFDGFDIVEAELDAALDPVLLHKVLDFAAYFEVPVETGKAVGG